MAAASRLDCMQRLNLKSADPLCCSLDGIKLVQMCVSSSHELSWSLLKDGSDKGGVHRLHVLIMSPSSGRSLVGIPSLWRSFLAMPAIIPAQEILSTNMKPTRLTAGFRPLGTPPRLASGAGHGAGGKDQTCSLSCLISEWSEFWMEQKLSCYQHPKPTATRGLHLSCEQCNLDFHLWWRIAQAGGNASCLFTPSVALFSKSVWTSINPLQMLACTQAKCYLSSIIAPILTFIWT